MLPFKAIKAYVAEQKKERKKAIYDKKHLSAKDRFLEEVIRQIRYPFDREEIRRELKDHMEERMEFEMERGLSLDEAQAVAVDSMGDPAALGKALNREHNPLLGILWAAVRIMMIPLVVVSIFTAVFPLAMLTGTSAFYAVFPPGRGHLPKEEIVYEVNHLNEKVQIDDAVIEFTDLIYMEDETLYVYYKSYRVRFGLPRWNYIPGPFYEDEAGNAYSGGGFQSAGIVSYCYDSLDGFPEDAEKLIVSHDDRGIFYRIEIQLPKTKSEESGKGVEVL